MGCYAAGRIVLIAVKGWRMVGCDLTDWPDCDAGLRDWSRQTQTVYLSVIFVLGVGVLLTWGIYQWKTDRRRRRGRGAGLILEHAIRVAG